MPSKPGVESLHVFKVIFNSSSVISLSRPLKDCIESFGQLLKKLLSDIVSFAAYNSL